MSESKDKPAKKEAIEEKENIIVDIFKKLLQINFIDYGGRGSILK